MKKLLSIILAILMVVTMIPMAVVPAYAATEASGLPTAEVSYYDGVTQYFKYNNYLYKIVWGNYKFHATNGTTSVKLVKYGNYLACYPNGVALCDYLNKEISGLRATRCTVNDLPKTINTSLNCFNEMSSRHLDTTKPIAVITCVGVNAPTWNWSDDKTSATAVFVSEDGKAQATVGATVTSSTVAAENCQEKDTITYTATATFNATAYSDVKTEDGAAGNHTGGEATCTAKAVCEACGESYGKVATDAHNWSNLDGVCANGCGEICPHDYDEGVLTRPIRITTTDWDDGYYTYTCSLCGHYYQETVKRADYSALDAVLDDFRDAMLDDSLLDSIKDELEKIYFDNINVLYGEHIESEQAEVDALAETMTQKLAEVEAGIEDGSALKPDYTEGDALINGIIEQFYDKGITYVDEIIAEFGVLYDKYMAIWHKPETAKPQVDEIVEELKVLKEKIDKGTEDGTLVEVNGLEEIVKINDALNEELVEKYGEEALAELSDKISDEVNAKFDELYEKAEALTGTVAENKDALTEIEAEMETLFAEIEKCLAGTHSFADYIETTPAKCEANAKETGICAVCGETDEREVEGTALEHIWGEYTSNGDATCTADGTKTAECTNGCGATDTVTDEDSMLDHADEDGDSLCDGCDKELICKDCGRPVHDDSLIQSLVCLIIMLIKLIMTAF